MTKVKRFSASAAAQLISCPGSARLEESIPGFVHPVRDDMAGAKGIGTNVHAVLEPFHVWPTMRLRDAAGMVREFSELHHSKRKLILGDEDEALLFLVKRGYDQTQSAYWLQQLVFEPKMLRFIADAAEYMADLLSTVDFSTTHVEAEEQLTADWLPSKPGTTPDVTIVSLERLEVVDYKSGAIEVSPVDNDQLMFYAACKLADAPHATEFTCHVIQPGNQTSWTAPIEHLKKWMALAVEADQRILAGSLELRPNDHCTFCPANPWSRGDKGNVMCPAQTKKLYPAVFDEDEIF